MNFFNVVKCPCIGCNERNAECHSKCKGYADYKSSLAESRNAGRRSDALFDYKRAEKEKYLRRRSKK